MSDNDCADWLPVCEAECCKQFQITLRTRQHTNKLKKGDFIRCFVQVSPDKALYYKYHGVRSGHGEIFVHLDDFTIDKGLVTVFRRCDGLTDDNQCRFHGTDKQPRVCQRPCKENHTDLTGINLTPRCKYNQRNNSA